MIRITNARRLGSVLGLLALCLCSLALKSAGENQGRSFVLPNGLKVFLYEKHDLPLFNMALAVDAGSKDETAETNGILHLLEHCILFRGTEFRSGTQVSRDIRLHGAYFNASTGQDLSVYEISLPSEHSDFALRNQKEILFDLALTQADLDEEKAVILEEMSQLEDDPLRRGTDLVMQRLFEGHPYGRPVYGTPEVVRAAKVEDVMAFHAKFFVPNNCALAVVGDFETRAVEEKIREIYGPLNRSDQPKASVSKASLLKKGVSVEEERDVKEAYLFLGYVGPDVNSPEQYAVDVLTEVLGRGVNPLLNLALRSRRDLVQNIGMSYAPGRFGGAIIISLTLDPKNLAAASREAINYLRRARDENYSKDDFAGDDRFYVFDFLGGAKNQIRFSAEQAEESGLTLASSLARFMLLNERENPGRFLDHISRTSSGDLRKAAAQYFGRGECVIVSIVPKRAAKRSRPGPE